MAPSPPVPTPIHLHTMCSIIILVGSALKLYMVCIHAKCPGNSRIIPGILGLPQSPGKNKNCPASLPDLLFDLRPQVNC